MPINIPEELQQALICQGRGLLEQRSEHFRTARKFPPQLGPLEARCLSFRQALF
jgi:hypothetical protein